MNIDIKANPMNNLFAATGSPPSGGIADIPLDRILDFPDHPFTHRNDDEMAELAQDIAQRGVYEPVLLIVAEDNPGYFYCISGHRRREASAMAGKSDIPAIVKEISMDEAIIMMVGSNLKKRAEIPMSEQAKAYKMMHDAIKRQAGRPSKENERQVGAYLKSASIVADAAGSSTRQVERILRLNQLIPPIMDYVDSGKMKLTPAVELSYLREEEQQNLLDVMEIEMASPSLDQAKALRALSEQDTLSYHEIHREMRREKPNQKNYAKIHPNIWQDYFRPDATAAEIERGVSKALKIDKSIGEFFSEDPTPAQLEEARKAITHFRAFRQKQAERQVVAQEGNRAPPEL